MKMFKRNNKVAVLISPGFGAGFSTDNHSDMAVDHDLIDAFLKSDMTRFKYIADEKYGAWYDGGDMRFKIEWVPMGCTFIVRNYDGNEYVEIIENLHTYKAE